MKNRFGVYCTEEDTVMSWEFDYDTAVNEAERLIKQDAEHELISSAYLVLEAVAEVKVEATVRTIVNEFPTDLPKMLSNEEELVFYPDKQEKE